MSAEVVFVKLTWDTRGLGAELAGDYTSEAEWDRLAAQQENIWTETDSEREDRLGREGDAITELWYDQNGGEA